MADGGGTGSRPLEVHASTPDRKLKPDLAAVKSAVLFDGPKVRRVVKHWKIRDRNTGAEHHDAIVIRTYRKRKDRSELDEQHSVTLTGGVNDEIEALSRFLRAVRSDAAEGIETGFLVLPTTGSSADAIQQVIDSATSDGKIDVLASVLQRTAEDHRLLDVLLERAERDPELFMEAALAINLAGYRTAVAELRTLIEKDQATEREFQIHLEKHPWMFGSEYSELLDRRNWTRGEEQDFMLRRTVDGYIEAVEIKTPLGGKSLFNYDKSHDSYYAASELSKVLGQVEKYIEELEADRHRIQSKDREDTNKIRAKIIIGRDRDERQTQALRRFNGHLHRIEVLTFDQLLKMAEGILGYLERSLESRVAEAD